MFICYWVCFVLLNEVLSGVWVSCMFWFFILLFFFLGDRVWEELIGGVNWFCLGLGVSEVFLLCVLLVCSLFGEFFVGECIFFGFGGGGFSCFRKKIWIEKFYIELWEVCGGIVVILILFGFSSVCS